MRSIVSVPLLALAVCLCRGGAEGRLTRPLSTWDRISSLYDSDKVDEARKLLKEHVEGAIARRARMKMETSEDIERRLGVGVILHTIANCLAKEEEKGLPPSEELIRLSALGRNAVDGEVEEALRFPDLGERARQAVEFCRRGKTELLETEISVLAGGGRLEDAQSLWKENAPFLRERGISLAPLLSGRRSDNKADKTSGQRVDVVGPGVTLPIVLLLCRYYRAFVSEDPKEIDKFLFKGQGLYTAEEIVEQIDSDRKTLRRFDVLDEVSFDETTRIDIRRSGPNEYAVTVWNALRLSHLEGREVIGRSTDQFTVKAMEGGYKLAIKKPQKAKRKTGDSH